MTTDWKARASSLERELERVQTDLRVYKKGNELAKAKYDVAVHERDSALARVKELEAELCIAADSHLEDMENLGRARDSERARADELEKEVR